MNDLNTFLMIQDYLEACEGVREQDSYWLKAMTNRALHERRVQKVKDECEALRGRLEKATIPENCRRADESELADLEDQLHRLESEVVNDYHDAEKRNQHCASIYLSTALVAREVGRAGGDPQPVRQLAEYLRGGRQWLQPESMNLFSSPDAFSDRQLVEQACELRELWEAIEPILHSTLEELRQLPRSDKEENEFTQIAEQLAGQKQDLFEMLADEGGWVEYETLRDSSVFRSSSVTDASIKRAIDRLKDDLTFLAPAWTVIIRKSKARLERV